MIFPSRGDGVVLGGVIHHSVGIEAKGQGVPRGLGRYPAGQGWKPAAVFQEGSVHVGGGVHDRSFL